MYGSMSPNALRDVLDCQPEPDVEPPRLNILDLTDVPYMDSFGLGTIVGHYASCQRKGFKMIAVGASPRVRELFKMTRVDTVISMAAAVEDADV